jgi:hypothetical protein
VSDTERELGLHIGVDGAAEAKTEFDSVAESAQGAGTAAAEGSTASASAAEAQEAAIAQVNVSLQNAMTAMGAFSTTAQAGGAQAEAAFLAVRDATAALEVAIEAAKAAGAPVSPAAIATLEGYDAALAATVAAQEAASQAAAKGKANFGLFRAEAALGSEALGPLGRALQGLASSSDASTASVGRLLLPLAAAAGAIAVLGKAMGELHDRGVEVSKLGDLVGSVMDHLAVALGGTSKATQEAVDAYEKAQKGLEDLTAATVSYKSGLDLIINSGLDLKAVLVGTTDAANQAAQQVEVLGEGVVVTGRSLGDTVDQIDRLNKNLNVLRVYSPQLAAEMSKDFAQIQHDIAAGVSGAATRLDELASKAQAAARSSDDLSKAIELTYGKDGPKAFATFSASAQQVIERFDRLREAGVTEQQAFGILKGQFETTAAGASQFAGVLATMENSSLPAAAAKAKELVAAFGGLQDAIDKNTKKTIEQGAEFTRINAIIQAHSGSLADAQRTIRALLPEIDRQIVSLEKQRDSEGKLQVLQQALLDQAIVWKQLIGETANESKKLTDAVDAHGKKIADLSKKYEDLTRTYEINRAKLLESSDTAIAAAQKQAAAVGAAADQQINKLAAAYRAGEIDSQDYFRQVADLQLKEVDARRDAEQKIDKITADRDESLADLQKKQVEATQATVTALAKEGESVESARVLRQKYEQQTNANVAALIKEANEHANAASFIQEHGVRYQALGKLVDDVAGRSVPSMIGAFQNLDTVVIQLNGHFRELVQLGSQLSVTGGGGDAGAGGTPGSEGG